VACTPSINLRANALVSPPRHLTRRVLLFHSLCTSHGVPTRSHPCRHGSHGAKSVPHKTEFDTVIMTFLMHVCLSMLSSGSDREQAAGECCSDVAAGGRGLLARRPPRRSHAGGHTRAPSSPARWSVEYHRRISKTNNTNCSIRTLPIDSLINL
jgi:hypothetical protein